MARTVDTALTESVLSMMEGMLPEYGALGKIKQPTGGAIATAAPTNAYPTKDNSWILLGANSEPLFAKLADLMERSDLRNNPDYTGNSARVANMAALDAIISTWTKRFDIETLLKMLNKADIPNSKVYTASDCAADPQYLERNMIRRVTDPHFAEPVMQAGIVPHVPESPGNVRWAGPGIGEHTDEILTELLGLSAERILDYRRKGVVA